MLIHSVLLAVDAGGWFNGAIIGGVAGLVIGGVYKLCFGGPGRQA